MTITYYKIALIIVITIAVYYIGLSGPFLYDDFINLRPFENLSSFSIDDVKYLLFGNISSDLGRPLSMLTFLIQPHTFPVNAFPYKVINLLIHCINGVLVYYFCTLLLQNIGPLKKNIQENIKLIAFMTMSLWLLHPLFVSTTLYAVQRMAQLSCLFILLTLIYFYRTPFPEFKNIKTFIIPTINITLLISLGVFSKENAALVFPMLLVLGLNRAAGKECIWYRRWLLSLTLIPILIILYKIGPLLSEQAYELSGYSMFERLITQINVLADYLFQVLLPQENRMTILHDDYPLKTNLFEYRTLINLGIILSLIFLAIKTKDKIIKLGISWFFIWHILESTILPLLLYFEHRNYIPAIGILLIISYGLVLIYDRLKEKQLIKNAIVFFPITILALKTFILSSIWANEQSLAIHWYKNHPKSELSFYNLVNTLEKMQNHESAYKLITKAVNNDFSQNLSMFLIKAEFECLLDIPMRQTIQQAITLSEQPETYTKALEAAHSALIVTLMSESNKCDFESADIHQLLNNIQQNSINMISAQWKSKVISEEAHLYRAEGMYEQALSHYIDAYYGNRIDLMIPIIDLSIKLNTLQNAQTWLERAENLEFKRPLHIKSYNKELIILKKKLEIAKAN